MRFISFLIKNKFPNRAVRDQLFSGPLSLSRSIFYGLFAGVLIVSYVILIKLNDTFLVTVPAHGGVLTEGIIGAPYLVNPILAATDTDMALAKLIYAGVMKEEGDGTIIPELAESYRVSPDGRTYSFTLRQKLFFHDHSPVTSSDVAFTLEKMSDAALNQTTASFWKEVRVETPDPHTVIITLPAPDTTFLKKMTIGILPQHEWQGVINEAFVDPSLNLEAIGAGAFKIDSITTDDSGAVKKLVLKRNRFYPLGAPYLTTLEVEVFANQEALLSAMKNGTIDLTFGLLPENLPEKTITDNLTITTIPTDTTVSLYRHENSSALANASLLATLNQFVDKESILATVENGYGIPQVTVAVTENATDAARPLPISLEETQKALSKLGYAIKDGTLLRGDDPVALGIATSTDPKLIAAGKALVGQLAGLGVIAQVQAFDQGTFKDELARSSFPLILSKSSAIIPQTYTKGIPLYTTAVVAVTGKNVYLPKRALLLSHELRYADVALWHERTDRIYRLFSKNN